MVSTILLLLIALVLFPFESIHHHHETVICEISKIHLEEEAEDCASCDFIPKKIDNTPSADTYVVQTRSSKQKTTEDEYVDKKRHQKLQDRAPPVFA